jgi:hypothetical protein
MAEPETHVDPIEDDNVNDVEMGGGGETADGPGEGEEGSALPDIESDTPAMTTFLE